MFTVLETFVLMGSQVQVNQLFVANRLMNSDGRILIDGKDITTMDDTELRETRRKKVSMVFQSFALLPHRTVIDNVAFGLEIQNISKEERYIKAEEAIAKVGLKGHGSSKISQLSGGMQQRVGLARALATDLIFCLWTRHSVLDPLIRTEMQDELPPEQTC